MASIGYGYGSEWHLLHELGRRRRAFTREVERRTGVQGLDWLDHVEYRDDAGRLRVRELTGLEFLSDGDPVKQAWEAAWPQRGTAQTWDAVGQAPTAGRPAWVLVEAKAHVDELGSSCGATGADSVRRIRAVLDEARTGLGVVSGGDWFERYYQNANRLALLHFLVTRGADAHLVFVYFTGDRADIGSPGRICPSDEAEWRPALDAQDAHLGLPADAPIRRRVHRLFVPVHHGHVAEQLLDARYR